MVKGAAAHKDVDVSEPDGAVGDEGGVEGVKVGDGLHVGDEDGDAEEEHDQDDPYHARVEPLVVVVLLLQPHLQLHQLQPGQGAPSPVHSVLVLVVILGCRAGENGAVKKAFGT